MDKRVIIAAVISIAILLIWMNFVAPPPAPPVRPPADVGAPATAADHAQPPLEPPAPQGVATVPALAASAAETHVVETPLYRIALTNRGGTVESWALREYTRADGEPLELFPRFVEDNRPRPLSLDLDDASITQRVNEALFTVMRESVEIGGRQGERLTLRWSDGTGLEATKTLTVDPASYIVELQADVLDRGRRLPVRIAVGPGFAAQELNVEESSYYYEGQLVANLGGTVSRTKKTSLAERPPSASPVRWAGLDDQYFAAVVLPRAASVDLGWRPIELTRSAADTVAQATAADPAEPAAEPLLLVGLPPEGAGLFVGPKKYDLLVSLGHGLDQVIWFSSSTFLAWVAKGIFLGLLWIHEHTVQNWGLAIVLATFALRLILFPVNQYSMVSMKKAQLQMQRLQPKVNAIRAKNKKSKDAESRARMNQELMDLYRKEGVNPMGGLAGCLPLLAQFPILIGFFNMLTVAVELRGAPFFGWIQDLSRKDPYYITPLLMGLTMFVQQSMAMTKVKDPQQLQQQKMMMFMPVVFTFICLNMPSGLVLYWFVNNILGIGQQWLVNRHTERLETAAQKA